ncbi:alpha-amylase family protein [Pirellulimonas nuda]|uniref:hypothetical protein n=1 Tax=Pirellulimonas nuda TaxID=2528009 RepID=UPI0011A823D6|nr:hypothetical protein [Pirellulimonas nuda]
MASAALAGGLSPGLVRGEPGRGSSSQGMFAAVQIAPANLLDEGIERCLDLLQADASINTLLCYSHTYHLNGVGPANVLADHGLPMASNRERRLPSRWVRHDHAAFKGQTIGHQQIDGTLEYGDRDALAEIVSATQRRGMKVHARILEASMQAKGRLPGYECVATVKIDGRPGGGPCWNHPAYVEWLVATVAELFRAYPLDGFQFGAERVGPLSRVLFSGATPECFCLHCVARNKQRGVDAERAKAGFAALQQLIRGLEAGGATPADGVLVSVFRVLMQYPEVLSWEREWFAADEEIGRRLYGAVKGLAPNAQFGRHIDHQRSSWDPIYRAAVDYGQIADNCDYIKPILYHDVLGRRMRWWAVERMQARVFADFTRDDTLQALYAMLGYDGQREPGLDELDSRGMSPEYVFRETRRTVAGAGGKAHVYSGIGLDVPWHLPDGGMEVIKSDPETIVAACQRAIDAGASGLVASREYDEMTLSSLRAFGRAVNSLTPRGAANAGRVATTR